MKSEKHYDHLVDVLGLHCPQPVINCKAALTRMAEGEILELVASDRGSLSEIPRLVEFLGDELIAIREVANQYRYTIRRNSTFRKGHVDTSSPRHIAGITSMLGLLSIAGPLEAY